VCGGIRQQQPASAGGAHSAQVQGSRGRRSNGDLAQGAVMGWDKMMGRDKKLESKYLQTVGGTLQKLSAP
jgi:hypothetical protein